MSATLKHVRPRQAAELSGLCEDTIRRLVKAGRLPSRRVGRAVLIPMSAIRAMLGCDSADPIDLAPTRTGDRSTHVDPRRDPVPR